MYELFFTNDSTLVVEDNNMFNNLKKHFNFTTIKDIIKLPEEHFVDLIAVVNEIGIKKTVNNKEFCELVLVDNSEYSIVCSLWGESNVAQVDQLKKGNIVAIKAGKTSFRYHGRAILVGAYSELILKSDDIQEADELKKWYDKKDFRNLKNISHNQCLLLDGSVCKIDDILDYAYQNEIPLIKNVAGNIIGIKEGTIYCCPNESCNNCQVDLQIKNRYICRKCKEHVSPKSITKLDVQVGNQDRSFKAACYGNTADNLLQEYRKNHDNFIFRIHGILKNNGVILSLIIMELPNFLEVTFTF